MVLLLKDLLEMLYNLLTKYKSNRVKFANYYEKEFYSKRFSPMSLLQIGIDNSIPVWNKYLNNCNIYCIDSFENKQPKDFSFLEDKKIYWSRCNIDDKKSIENLMIEIWKNPRFDIIIDNTRSFDKLRKYCIGSYYSEVKNEVFCHSC